MRRASTHDITVCETNLHPELTVLGEGGSKRKKNRARIDSQTRHLCLLRSCPISRLKSIQISQEVFFFF